MTTRYLAAPALGTGVLMAAYLLLRPYGDVGGALDQAQAYASPRWVVAHVCGLLALASFARLALRVCDLIDPGVGGSGLPGARSARLGRWLALAGATLALPPYGVEAVGLHVAGVRHLAGDPGALALVSQLRGHPLGVAMFALGLALLAAAGIALGLTWQRSGLGCGLDNGLPTGLRDGLDSGLPIGLRDGLDSGLRNGLAARSLSRFAAWPLGVLMAAFVPQFLLPPAGRMAYGVAYLAAALWLLGSAASSRTDGADADHAADAADAADPGDRAAQWRA